MELNHILIALGSIVGITIVAYFLTRPKYYKETTIYMYFQTTATRHDRVVFIKDGFPDPEDILDVIREQREDVEKIAGAPAVLKNIKIFKPQWKQQ